MELFFLKSGTMIMNRLTLLILAVLGSTPFLGVTDCNAQSEKPLLGRERIISADPVAQGAKLEEFAISPPTFPNNGKVYIERAGGLFLEYFNIKDGIATGWTISYMTDKGWDTFGRLNRDRSFRWSTSGRSRLEYGAEYDYLSPYPWRSYDYIDSTGYSRQGGTIDRPRTCASGSVYESFSDGLANGWLADDRANWSIEDHLDPGHWGANRVYVDRGVSGRRQRVSLFDFRHTVSAGFTCSVDASRHPESVGEVGLIFCADNVSAGDCYTFTVDGDSYCLSKWIASEKTILIRDRSSKIDGSLREWNNLKIVLFEGTIDLYIDDSLVNTFHDPTHRGGRVGIFCDVDKVPNRFDNFTCHRDTSKSTRKAEGGE